MKFARSLAAAEDLERLALKRVSLAKDTYRRRYVLEMGSVSCLPSTTLTIIG